MVFNNTIFLFLGLFLWSQIGFSQTNKLPSVDLLDLQGKIVKSSEITNDGKPILICFWKTCCKPPVDMLDAISEVYEDWVDETGVVLYAISIDDSRSSSQVKPFINGKEWEFEVLLDPNSDFKRSMNVVMTPHLFLLNSNGEIVWQKALFVIGDEEEILEQIKKLTKD